mmetsp:Transcript_14313/g.34893  ORF Transcript_14313/g.34893 Transcript_14313/m.34893 type:complete len:101 (+) Transcript_14313:243-545(+)
MCPQALLVCWCALFGGAEFLKLTGSVLLHATGGSIFLRDPDFQVIPYIPYGLVTHALLQEVNPTILLLRLRCGTILFLVWVVLLQPDSKPLNRIRRPNIH